MIFLRDAVLGIRRGCCHNDVLRLHLSNVGFKQARARLFAQLRHCPASVANRTRLPRFVCNRVYFKRGVQPKCGVQNEKMWSPRLKSVESKIAFGQLILRKIIKTVATRCQILRLKCTKIQNSTGDQPQIPLGELTALSQTP